MADSDGGAITVRLLVTGGRAMTRAQTTQLCRALNAFARDHEVSVVIHGACPHPTRGWIATDRGRRLASEAAVASADMVADEWARFRQLKVDWFRADWQRDGKKAGPIRNQRMIDEGRPTHAIAAVGGRGTADCVRRARAAGLPVIELVEGAAG